MSIQKTFILSFLHFLLFLPSVFGTELKTLEMTDEENIYLIGSVAQIYEDKTNLLSISDINSKDYIEQFKKAPSNYPNLGVSNSTFWIRFKIKSEISFRAFLFNIGYLFHDKIEMYQNVNGNPEQIFFSDIKMGTISHDHDKRNRFAVPIELKAGEETEYYLSIKDHEGVTLFLELSSEENFLRRQSNENLRVGIIAGIFLLASAFSLVVFMRDKHISYLYFFLLNLSFVLTLLCFNGNLQILFWPGNLHLNHDFFIFSGFATNALSFLFTTYFLELKVKSPKWYVAGIAVAFFMLLGAISPLTGLDHFIVIFYIGQIIGSVFELIVSFNSLKQGEKLSKYFFFTRLLFSTSILSYALIKLGILPYPGPLFEAFGSAGICIQVALMTFVISDYKYKSEINKLAEEKNKEQQRNEELFNANKVKMEFIGMASHDLKGPLRNISVLASFIENKQVSSEVEVNHMASMIRQSSEKLANLVKDLLDNTALEMGKLELKLEELDVLKCIHSIVEQYELEAQRKKQTIEVIAKLDQKLVLKLDEIRFSQVIENLLSNAIKFSPFDKRIWIVVSKASNTTCRIEIRDEGPGFTEEDKQYLFNYYKKLSAKPTGKESSSGLGLSIVKKIVELHNGKIWLESEEGKGASFFVEV